MYEVATNTVMKVLGIRAWWFRWSALSAGGKSSTDWGKDVTILDGYGLARRGAAYGRHELQTSRKS